MEHIPCICRMRDLCLSLTELEDSLLQLYGTTLNEAMVLCCIGTSPLPAGDIARHTGIRSSHLSKVLRSLEQKALVTRAFGDKDKRQIYFSLTTEALHRLNTLKTDTLPIPPYNFRLM
ncbi:MAG: MarR family transcriptional regulator, partial [Bacteroidaceae bacterium]|nr:MarR family transcriptional regulator [Bacteroidaceae bacterium]